MNLTRYKPNTEEIIYQMIEGEYILLNLSNGNYFSLDNLGVLIWRCVENSIPQEELFSLLRDQESNNMEALVNSARGVFEALVTEGLALPVTDSTGDENRCMEEFRQMIRDGKVHLKPATLHAYKNIQEKYAHPCGVKEI